MAKMLRHCAAWVWLSQRSLKAGRESSRETLPSGEDDFLSVRRSLGLGVMADGA